MAKFIGNLRDIWGRTPLIQRVILLAVLIGCVGAMVLLVGWARRPHMAMLYSRLDPDDAARVVEKIRDAGVQYELTEGGGTIKVPAEKVYSLRLTLAADGLPAGGEKGYRILDEAEIGTSPFKERVNYIRAIEGELAKTLQMLEGVVSARVHVVRPESTLFASQKRESSATVALKAKPGWRLTPTNIAAIVHLVSGSVEGLTPANVVVVDSQGNLLSGDGEEGPSGRAGNFLEYKRMVEEYLSAKVENMLASALGSNRARVSVDAVVETNSVSEMVEKYDPDGRVIAKEELKTSSSAPPAGGGGAQTAGVTKEEETLSEYKVSRTVQQKTDLPGQIKSLSVAVLVDLSPPPKKEGEEGGAPAPTITPADVEEITRNAIGLKETDTLTVKQTTFARPAPLEAVGPEEEGGGLTDPGFLLEMARRFSLGILVIGALLALRIFRRSKKKAAEAEAPQGPSLPALAGGGGKLLPTASGQAEPELLRAQITNALQNNPEEVKRLFLGWVESEKGGA